MRQHFYGHTIITYAQYLNNLYILSENDTQYDGQDHTLEVSRVFGTSPSRARENYRYNNEGEHFCTTYHSVPHTTGS